MCGEEGRLGLPGQVWELRLWPSFPSCPGENRSSNSVWDSPRHLSTTHPRPAYIGQGAPKERRRGRAEKRLSKKVFLESPFLLSPLKVFS